jgi:hypothetical protein
MYKRYLGVLDASKHPKDLKARAKTLAERNAYAERQAYDTLREGLRGGNIAARLYTDWLTKFLGAVDRFFGDADMADRTLFPHVIGLKKAAPLWTVSAFDRCLLLALIYPITSVVIIWVISGHVGPAEAAFGLKPSFSWMQRTLIGLALGATFACSRYSFGRGDWKGLGLGLLAIALCVAIMYSGVASVALIASGVGVAVVFYYRAIHDNAHAATVLTFALVFPVGFASNRIPNAPVALFDSGSATFAAIFAIIVAVAVLNEIALKREWLGPFLGTFTVVFFVVCLCAAYFLSPFVSWAASGPSLLFLGVLTLINAPFDWASLGLTRALLRRGLELGGWWPCFLALADALAATVIIPLLAIATVIGVQTFDHLAEHSGGPDARILPLDKLFDGIAAQPSAPEYWWLYALLLSTMFPSLLNLMIGGASLLRGVPGLPSLLLRFMPASKAVPAFDRTWLALVLTSQVFIGAFLGIAAQFVLAIGVIFYVLPWMGLELLDAARAAAEFDLPLRVLKLWWGGP